MSSATMELYNALISVGVDKDKAEAAAKAVISREEGKEFATKSDISLLKTELRTEIIESRSQLIMWMAGFHISSLAMIAALLSQLI